MTMNQRYQHEYLRRGLLYDGDEGGTAMFQRYQTNAEFRASIDTLAAVLPIFVEALAKHCDEQASKAQAMMEMINNTPYPPTFNLPDEKSDQTGASE